MLCLKHNQTNISIAYASDNHIYGNSDRFFYKMDGVDPDWVDAGNRREVFYSNLAPGNYLLRIKALYGRVGGHLLFMLLLFSTYCNAILPISKGNNG